MRVNWHNWSGKALARHMTWVRTPGLLHSHQYFFNYLPMQRPRPGSSCTLIIKMPTCPGRSTKGLRFKEHHKDKSTCHIKSGKVNKFQCQWASILGPTPHKLGLPPPLVCFSFHILFIYFNYCVIYFYCFN